MRTRVASIPAPAKQKERPTAPAYRSPAWLIETLARYGASPKLIEAAVQGLNAATFEQPDFPRYRRPVQP